MREGAETAVTQCMNVSPGETVLVITDRKRRKIGRAIEAAASTITDTVYAEIPTDERHGTEPPAPVAAAMKTSDVVFVPTTRSLTHTRARREACEAGARVATMPSITEQIMNGAMRADFRDVQRRADRLHDRLKGNDRVRITADAGTDLTIRIGNQTWARDTGICHDPGCYTNLPAGELYVAPTTGDGTLVVDGSMSGLGILDEPVEIQFEDGKATSISNPTLRNLVEDAGDCGRNLAELGIGINPAATLIGTVLQDEKVMGTVHIAIGDNAGFGGDVECDLHLDGIVKNPTIRVNGERIPLR